MNSNSRETTNIFEEIHYDAFISYRHNPLDEYVAQHLQELLETYTVPENVKDIVKKNKINKIFRDMDELPLSDNLGTSIETALKNSDYLIVICSPTYRESKWCMKEIDTFIEHNGYGKIILVLTEGTTDTSFPPQLLNHDTEPFASDVRGKDYLEISKKLKVEHVRVAASILEVPYDTLRQRENERQALRKTRIATYAAFAIGAIALISAITFMIFKGQRASINKNQANELVEEALINYESGNTEDAINYMLEAEDVYSSEAKQDDLTKILGIYDNVSNKKSVYSYKADAPIKAVKTSASGKYALFSDEFGCITIIDTDNNNNIVCSINDIYTGLSHTANEGFLDETTIYYVNSKKRLIAYDFIRNSTVNEAILISNDMLNTYQSPGGKYLAITSGRFASVMNTDTWKFIYEYEIDDYHFYGPEDDGNLDKSIIISDYAAFVDNDRFVFATCDKRVNSDEEAKVNHKEKLYLVDCKKGDSYSTVNTGLTYTYFATQQNDKLYICGRNLGSNNDSFVTTVKCLDSNTGDELTEFSLENFNVNKIIYTDKDKLLFVSGNTIKLLNPQNGETIDSVSLTSGNISYISDMSNDKIKIISSEGIAINYKLSDNSISQFGQANEYNVSEFKDLYIISTENKDLIYATPSSLPNIVNEYKYVPATQGESVNAEPVDVTHSDGIFFKDDYVADSDKTIANTYGPIYCKLIPDSRSYVIYVFPEGRIITVQRGNDKVIDDKMVGFTVEKVAGIDSNNNEYYVERHQDKTPGNAIAISKSGHIITVLKDFINLTEDSNGVILNTPTGEQNTKTYMSYPIYTYKELLIIAKQRVKTK